MVNLKFSEASTSGAQVVVYSVEPDVNLDSDGTVEARLRGLRRLTEGETSTTSRPKSYLTALNKNPALL